MFNIKAAQVFSSLLFVVSILFSRWYTYTLNTRPVIGPFTVKMYFSLLPQTGGRQMAKLLCSVRISNPHCARTSSRQGKLHQLFSLCLVGILKVSLHIYFFSDYSSFYIKYTRGKRFAAFLADIF